MEALDKKRPKRKPLWTEQGRKDRESVVAIFTIRLVRMRSAVRICPAAPSGSLAALRAARLFFVFRTFFPYFFPYRVSTPLTYRSIRTAFHAVVIKLLDHGRVEGLQTDGSQCRLEVDADNALINLHSPGLHVAETGLFPGVQPSAQGHLTGFQIGTLLKFPVACRSFCATSFASCR